MNFRLEPRAEVTPDPLRVELDRLKQENAWLRQQIALPQHDDALQVQFSHTVDAAGVPADEVFLLRPERDPAARTALRAYADATNNIQLRYDILIWIGDATESDRPQPRLRCFDAGEEAAIAASSDKAPCGEVPHGKA